MKLIERGRIYKYITHQQLHNLNAIIDKLGLSGRYAYKFLRRCGLDYYNYPHAEYMYQKFYVACEKKWILALLKYEL
jgi:hypothetical protein